MRLPSVPGPGDLRQLVEQALAVAPRAANLLTGAETLLAQAGGIVGQVQALLVRVEDLLEGVEGTRVRADEVIEGVDGTSKRADDVVEQAQRIADRGERAMGGLDDVRERADVLLRRVEEGAVGRMLDLAERLEPSLRALEPVLRRLAETTSPAEVDAVVGLVDKVPVIEDALREDILPLLHRLDTLAPDMHQMLEVTQELAELVVNLPGMGRIRKKVEEQQESDGD